MQLAAFGLLDLMVGGIFIDDEQPLIGVISILAITTCPT